MDAQSPVVVQPGNAATAAFGAVSDAAERVSRWTPQQLIGVSVMFFSLAVTAFLGWRIYSEDKTKTADREAAAAAQAQLLRFMESQQEKTAQLNSAAVEKGQAFYAGEVDKQRRHFAEQERARIEAGQKHMAEAMTEMRKLGSSIDSLTKAVDGFTRKTGSIP